MQQGTINIIRSGENMVVAEWMQTQLAEDLAAGRLLTTDRLEEQCREVVVALIDLLSAKMRNEDDGSAYDLLRLLSVQRAKLGFTPRETGHFILNLKYALLSLLQKELTDPSTLFSESRDLESLINSFAITTFEDYVIGRESEILRNGSEISDIGTPLITLWDGVLGTPIVGTLDSSRAEGLTTQVLHAIAKDDIQVLIIDISGVPAIDSSVAEHLIKMANAVRLLGAQCIVSGMRPEIAQAIVHLGIDLGGLVTKASLASALKMAFQAIRLNVVPRSGK